MRSTPCFVNQDPTTNSTTTYIVNKIWKRKLILPVKAYQVVMIHTPNNRVEDTINQVIATCSTRIEAIKIAYLTHMENLAA